jgi:hypothetical protein
MKRLLLLLGVVLLASGPLYAGGHHGCCADCGCNHGLRKVCRWVCEEVEEKAPCWDCECEDIVIPGKSPFCIKEDCDDGCRDRALHFGGRLHQKKGWGPPSDCRVKTVNVLVRTEKTIKKKVWKPVVETVCDTCCAAGGHWPGGCTDGPAPMLDGMCSAEPTVAPQGDSQAPLPPMPPVPTGQETSLRRGLSAIAPVFTPVSRKR